jgi:hypothetical protein
MKRREFIALLGGAATWPFAARAQQPAKVFSVGWLTAQRASSLTPFLDVFRSGLAELGYREGDNLRIEYRYGDDNLLRVAPLAAELTRQGINLLVVQGAAVPLIYELKLPVPSVYVFSGDPVVAGIAQSLARPGGNMTGLTFMAPQLNAKRLELLNAQLNASARMDPLKMRSILPGVPAGYTKNLWHYSEAGPNQTGMISPSPIPGVERLIGGGYHLPGRANALGAAEAKHLHQVNLAIV